MAGRNEYFTIIEDQSVNRLMKRLSRGMRLKSRIVLVLKENQYVIRIQGRNLIMQSSRRFKRLEDIWVEVEQVRPKLKLRLLKVRKALQKIQTNLTI